MIAIATLLFVLPLQVDSDPSETSPTANRAITAASAPAADNVARIYDVTSLALDPFEANEEYPDVLAPFSRLSYWDQLSFDGNVDEERGADRVISLLVDIVGAEFEYEGREIHEIPGGRIYVRGPEALQARVKALLSFLDRLVNAQIELTVDVIELAVGSEAPLGGRMIVTKAEAEAWMQERQGPRENMKLLLRADRPSELELTRSIPLVVDYDVEIAQGSAIGDPISFVTSIGKRLKVRAVPAPNGVALSVLLMRGSPIGDVQERSLGAMGHALNEQGMVELNVSETFQSLDVLNRSIAFDAVLGGEQALVLYSSIDLERDKRSEVVVMRLTGGDLPLHDSHAYGPNGEELVAFDLSYSAPPRIQASGTLVGAGGPPFRLSSWVSGGSEFGILSAYLYEADAEFAYDAVQASSDMVNLSELGSYRLAHYYTYGRSESDEPAREMAKVSEAIDGLGVDERMIEVAVELTRHGKWSSSPVRARVPVRLGHTSCLALGIESDFVGDYDVEVAQQASVPDAIVLSDFEGLVLWLHGSESPSGDIVLDVCVGAAQNAGPRRVVEVGSGSVEQTSVDQLMSRQRFTLRQDAEGPWRAELGGTASGGLVSSLRLSLEVAR